MTIKNLLFQYFTSGGNGFVRASNLDERYGIEYIELICEHFLSNKDVNFISVAVDDKTKIAYYDFTRFCKDIEYIIFYTESKFENIIVNRSDFDSEKAWMEYLDTEVDNPYFLDNVKDIGVELIWKRIEVKNNFNYKIRYMTNIHKLLGKLSIDPYYEYDDEKIRDKVIRAYYTHTSDDDNFEFQVVRGEDIRYWYHEDNYNSSSDCLGSSCMRYKKCQDYFDIYVDNDDVIEMGILTLDGKLVARQLIWDKKFYDRAYYEHPRFEEMITRYSKDYIKEYDSEPIDIYDCRGDYNHNYSVQLKYYEYDRYPFVDSFVFLTSEGVLHCNQNREIYKVFGYTDGESLPSPDSYHIGSYFRDDAYPNCHYSDAYLNRNNSFRCSKDGEYYHNNYKIVINDKNFYRRYVVKDYWGEHQLIDDCEQIGLDYVPISRIEEYRSLTLQPA